jgi:hypothetical protein
METVDTKTLRELVRAGSVTHVRAVASDGGFEIALGYGCEKRLLEAAKGHVRRFSALDSVASYLKSIGIANFEVDTTRWVPKRRKLN